MHHCNISKLQVSPGDLFVWREELPYLEARAFVIDGSEMPNVVL